MNTPNIRTIVHFGACEDEQSYVQAVGRTGRDGLQSNAVVLARKGGRQHINEAMIEYVNNV